MFKVGDTTEIKVKELHLFNDKTEIIKEGQRHKVVFGQLEEERRSLH